MFRSLLFLLSVAACCGCHAPVPTFNPLAPYGNPVVPPPATSSYGTPNTYYPNQPTSMAPAGSGEATVANTQLADGMTTAGTTRWRPDRQELAQQGPALRPVSAMEPVVGSDSSILGGAAEPAIRIVEPRGGSSPPLVLNGMPVIDATQQMARPAGSGGPVKIAQLPDAQRAPRAIEAQVVAPRALPVGPARPIASPVQGAAPYPYPAPALSASAVGTGIQWKSRYSPGG